MVQEIFYWLFNMSITASLVAIPVIAIRFIKPISRRLIVALWAVPFLRLSLPFGMHSPYSFMSLLSGISVKTVTVYQPVKNFYFTYANFAQAAETYFPVTYKVNILDDVFGIASVIWLSVAVVIFLLLAIFYCFSMWEVKKASHWKNNLYLSSYAVSPAVYGIIKPKILLPESCKDTQLHYILLHEQAHIRRGDNLWRLLAIAVTTIHWFNPFCWLFLKLFLADLELACDEAVLKKLGQAHAKSYAQALLDSKQHTQMLTSAFGGAKINTRIKSILSFKEMTRLSVIIFSVLIIAISYILLTNAG